MGGLDVDPKKYGEEPLPSTRMACKESDQVECELVRRAVRDRKPVLAICRGIQVMNVASGGTLHQHIPLLDLAVQHGSASEGSEYRYVNDTYHTLRVEQDSRFFTIVGKQTLEVNSGHHQCLKDVASEFRVAGRAECGTVEVIEHINPDYFSFAVQCHPEYPGESFLEEAFLCVS